VTRRAFLVVTTRDLPEAYVLADFLLARGQRLAILSITGRPFLDQLRIFRRLGRNRGRRYLLDLLARRLLALLCPLPTAFPEIDARVVAAVRRHVDFFATGDPHAPAALRFVHGFAPDHILLAGAPVLRPALFGLARHGALNRHLGLLPYYRGSDCPVWTLADDAPERLGFTIHQVAERVDAGAIVLMRRVPVLPELPLEDYLRALQVSASEAFVSVLDTILHGGDVEGVPAAGGGRYCPPAGLSAWRRACLNYARAVGDAAWEATEDLLGPV